MSFVLDLTKKFELELSKAGMVDIPILETRLAVDRSGSMLELYRNGFVETMISRFIPAAIKFDDNQSLEMGFFDTEFEATEDAKQEDATVYMKTKGKDIVACGGTHYAPILVEMMSTSKKEKQSGGFFSKLISGLTSSNNSDLRVSNHRAYLSIITDGSNDDRPSFENYLKRSTNDTYIQFIAIGTSINRTYLDNLANTYPFIDVLYFPNPNKISDDEFYEAICTKKFIDWANN